MFGHILWGYSLASPKYAFYMLGVYMVYTSNGPGAWAGHSSPLEVSREVDGF